MGLKPAGALFVMAPAPEQPGVDSHPPITELANRCYQPSKPLIRLELSVDKPAFATALLPKALKSAGERKAGRGRQVVS
jgi:hypothetical protein